MIEIIESKNPDTLPKEIAGHSSIDVVDVISKSKDTKSIDYLCVIDGIMETVKSYGGVIYPLSQKYPESKCRDMIGEVYQSSYKDIPGFIPTQKPSKMIQKLFELYDGESFDMALEYVRNNVDKFKGYKRKPDVVLSADYGMFVGNDKPIIRRYSDNLNPKTFDCIDIVIKTVSASKNELEQWYLQTDDNKKCLIQYGLNIIEKNTEYKKYGVSVDYLCLDHLAIGKSRFLLTFRLKNE